MYIIKLNFKKYEFECMVYEKVWRGKGKGRNVIIMI